MRILTLLLTFVLYGGLYGGALTGAYFLFKEFLPDIAVWKIFVLGSIVFAFSFLSRVINIASDKVKDK